MWAVVAGSLEVQELNFWGAEKGGSRGSMYPSFLVSGKEKGGDRRWEFHGNPQPSALGLGPLIIRLCLLRELM